MKFIDYSAVSASLGMRAKSGLLEFMNLIPQETAQAIIWALHGILPTSTDTYVLAGCINTGTGSNYIISAGVIYRAGELSFVPATTFTVTGGNTAIVTTLSTSIVDSRHNQVKFSDGTLKNVFYDLKKQIVAGASGSGNIDYADLNFDYSVDWQPFVPSLIDTNNSNAPVTPIFNFSRIKRIGNVVHLRIKYGFVVPNSWNGVWIELPAKWAMRPSQYLNTFYVNMFNGTSNASIVAVQTYSSTGSPNTNPNNRISFEQVLNMAYNVSLSTTFVGSQITIDGMLTYEPFI